MSLVIEFVLMQCTCLELRTISKRDNKIGPSGIDDGTSKSNGLGWACGTVPSGDKRIEHIGARAPASKFQRIWQIASQKQACQS